MFNWLKKKVYKQQVQKLSEMSSEECLDVLLERIVLEHPERAERARALKAKLFPKAPSAPASDP